MAEVRKRTTVTTADTSKLTPAEAAFPEKPTSPTTRARSGWQLTDVLRILGGILLLNCTLSYFVTNESVTWGWRPWYSKPNQVLAWMKGPVLLTDEQLTLYNGTDPAKPIYVALNGSIYDVSAGRSVYGPGGSYHFFAGRDATRAFITGCFQEDLTPDTRGAEETYVPVDDDEDVVSKKELKMRRERDFRFARQRVEMTIDGWSRMFMGQGGKNYFKVGEVKREEGWLEKLPRRKLCERAQQQRPKRSA